MYGMLGSRLTEEMTLRNGVKVIFVHDRDCTAEGCVCPGLQGAGLDFLVYLPGVDLCD